MTNAEINAFLQELAGKSLEELRRFIDNSSASPESGLVRNYNEAIWGWDVKDDILKFVLTLREYCDRSFVDDNELTDIRNAIPLRVGDQTTFDSAGDAVRAQISKLKALIDRTDELNSYNLLSKLRNPARIHHGVTCTDNGDGSFTFNGTATDNGARFNYLTEEDDLPSFIIPGESYYFKLNIPGGSNDFWLVFYCYNSDGVYIGGFNSYIRNGYFKVPEGTAKIRFRYEIEAGTNVNNVTIRPYMMSSLSDKELESEVNKIWDLIDKSQDFENYNLLSKLNNPERTNNGVTCIRNSDGSLTFSGTAGEGGSRFNYLTMENDSVPSFIIPGDNYFFSSGLGGSQGFWLVFHCYDKNGNYIDGFKVSSINAYFKVPKGTAKIRFRYEIEAGTTINNVTIYSYMYSERDVSFGEGNPIVLKGTAGGRGLLSLSLFGSTDGKTLTVCGKNLWYINTEEMTHRVIENVDFRLHEDGRVVITSDGATGTALSSGSIFGEKFGYVNGTPWWHNFKFKFKEDTVVAISGNWSVHQTSKYKVHMQVSDGDTMYYVGENGLILNAIGGKEYAIRWSVSEGWSGDITFRPQIEIGSQITNWEPFSGGQYTINNGDISEIPISIREATTLYTDDNSTIGVYAEQMKIKERSEFNEDAIDILKNITGGKEPVTHRPMVSLVDDDTASIELINRYKDVLDAKNVVGNYAVRTKKLDDVAGLSDKLLEYEQEGFGCIYHCYWQSGDSTRYWEFTDPSYDQDLIKENFMHGLRSMAEYGFSNYKFWVTPYGVNDKFIQDLAKKHGMNCLFTLSTYNHGIVTRNGNVSRWSIPRLILSADTDIDRLKENIDALAETDGWMTIVTHANEWGDDPDAEDSMDNILKEVIQYILDKDIDIKTVPEAFEEMRTSFMLHDLFN